MKSETDRHGLSFKDNRLDKKKKMLLKCSLVQKQSHPEPGEINCHRSDVCNETAVNVSHIDSRRALGLGILT